jgi:hypothetical protein
LAFLEGADYSRGQGLWSDPPDSYVLLKHEKVQSFPEVTYQTAVQLGSGIGYSMFYVVFYFDADGKLVEHGCWE